MILPIVRTALVSLRRDRAALALSFILPISFFSIFAVVFGGRRDTTPKITIIAVDQDHSQASRDLLNGLEHESSLTVLTAPAARRNAPPSDSYTAATAETAVKAGEVSVALIIPQGFGASPISFGPDRKGAAIQLLSDSSDPVAPQMVAGLLQKAVMTSMPVSMAEQGMKYSEKYLGDFTPEQRKRMNDNLARLRDLQQQPSEASSSSSAPSSSFSGIIAIDARPVVGENKKNPMVSFYAAAAGVMFLLFTASGAAGSLLDEAESGALDRVLSSRISMSGLLAGKLVYNVLLAFAQLTVMFLWGWAVFKLDFFTQTHIQGFVVMGICTAFAVASFGMLLASVCRTRAQLGALSTLIILTMSAVGGSMFPRFLMPEAMQKAGLWTINAWAIDGFTKVFWRDLPVSELWPQVSVLLSVGAVLFLIARRLARRWEYS